MNRLVLHNAAPGPELKWNRGMTLLGDNFSLENSNGDVATTSLGYQYTVQTTTQIRSKVIKQQFYEVAPADFVDVIPGNGAFMEDIKTNVEYMVAGAFEEGLTQSGNLDASAPSVDVGTAPITTKVMTWVRGYNWSTLELEKALRSNNWDLVQGRQEALKKNWDLGIQKVAFLGLAGNSDFTGLLNNAQVTSDTSVITESISAMSAANFATFVGAILAAYFSNGSNAVKMPNVFAIPLSDYLGLVTPIASGYPVVSKLTYLEDAFKKATRDPNFKIEPLVYCEQANNNLSTNRYVLYRKDTDVLWMDLPIDFTLNPAGTSDNFRWNGVAYGQFTGVTIARPKQVLYFDYAD